MSQQVAGQPAGISLRFISTRQLQRYVAFFYEEFLWVTVLVY